MLINKIKVIGCKSHEIILLNLLKILNNNNIYLITTLSNNIVMFSSLNIYLITTTLSNNIVMFNNLNIIYMYKHNQCIKLYIQIIEHQCILKIVKHLFINQCNKQYKLKDKM